MISLKQTRSKTIVLAAVCLFAAMQAMFCQPASAQRLIDRLRSRIQSRYAPPPPPQPPYRNPGQSPQAPGISGSPRVLATPLDGRPDFRAGQPRAATPLGAGTSATESRFGIEVTTAVDGPYRGLQILGFSPDSRAPSVGLAPGDLIVSIDGIRTETLASVAEAQRRIAAGRGSLLYVVRDGQLYQTELPAIAEAAMAEAAIAEASDGSDQPDEQAIASQSPAARAAAKPPLSASGPTLAKPRASLGLAVADATPQRGVLVVTVREGTAGEKAGLKPDDRIVSAAGRLIRDTSGLMRELALSNPGDSVSLGIVRADTPLAIEVEMGGPGGVPARGASEAMEAMNEELPAPVTETPTTEDILPAPDPLELPDDPEESQLLPVPKT